MTSPSTLPRAAASLLALATAAAWPASRAMAADGCTRLGTAEYQLEQVADLVVSNDMPPGTEIRDVRASGTGVLIAECAGNATFEGKYVGEVDGDIRPLMVNGVRSGFGARVFLEETKDGQSHVVTSRYALPYASPGEPVRSNQTTMNVKIVRMPGKVQFGRIDSDYLAGQWTYDRAGAKSLTLRQLKVSNLVLTAPTCALVPDDLTQTINMVPRSYSMFANVDRATPWETFSIGVEKCEDPDGRIARFRFGVPGDADVNKPELFWLNGPSNVGLELATADKKTLAPAAWVNLAALGMGSRYQFHMRLRETQPVLTAGKFTRAVKVLVEFL